MLLMWFTLPIANNEGPEDILDSSADFILGMVTNKLGGGSTVSNNILQRVDKCFFGSQGLYITNSGGQAIKKLGNCHTRVNSRNIRVHSVCSKCFITPMDIQGWEWLFVVLLEDSTHGHPGILGGTLEGMLDNILHYAKKAGRGVIS
jgi:hypothetical protein